MKYTYKDFETGKIHATRGQFEGWTAGRGIIGAECAVFRTKAGRVMIPDYLLTKETRTIITGEVKP